MYGDKFELEKLNLVERVLIHDFNKTKLSLKSLVSLSRGVEILREIYSTNCFNWHVITKSQQANLQNQFTSVLTAFIQTLTTSKVNRHNTETILSRLLLFLQNNDVFDFKGMTVNHLRNFIIDVSIDRPKSMDDVIGALRKFFKYIKEKGYTKESYFLLISAPRARTHKIYPAMSSSEMRKILNCIDTSTTIEKRDFAILSLATTTGLRSGDIASLKLENIKWLLHKLHFTQGKTKQLLILPLEDYVLTALSDYILRGRPKSDDKHVFLRNLAPFVGFTDGGAIASVFKRHLENAGICHEIGDGKTMHGIRRMIGTAMVSNNPPITTVAEVLGHKNIKSTKQYLALDLDGLSKCTLSMTSLEVEQK